MSVRILAVGDVCGQPGLGFLEKRLKEYKKEQNIAFAVVNGENANVVRSEEHTSELQSRI